MKLKHAHGLATGKGNEISNNNKACSKFIERKNYRQKDKIKALFSYQ